MSSVAEAASSRQSVSLEERVLITAVVTAGALVRLLIGTDEPTITPDPYADDR